MAAHQILSTVPKNFERLSKVHFHWGSMKKLFLKISQNRLENTCVAVSSFNKFAGLSPTKLLSSEYSNIWHLDYIFIFDNFNKWLKVTSFFAILEILNGNVDFFCWSFQWMVRSYVLLCNEKKIWNRFLSWILRSLALEINADIFRKENN